MTDKFEYYRLVEREALALGNIGDDELAEMILEHYTGGPSLKAIEGMTLENIKQSFKCSGTLYLKAAQERIRWLSRRLESKLGSNASDLLWNDRDDGRLPVEQTWKDFELVPLLNGKTCAPEVADTYRLCGVTSTVTYWLHTCSSYSEALERMTVLEKLR